MYELTPGPPSQPPHRCPWPGGLSWPQLLCLGWLLAVDEEEGESGAGKEEALSRGRGKGPHPHLCTSSPKFTAEFTPGHSLTQRTCRPAPACLCRMETGGDPGSVPRDPQKSSNTVSGTRARVPQPSCQHGSRTSRHTRAAGLMHTSVHMSPDTWPYITPNNQVSPHWLLDSSTHSHTPALTHVTSDIHTCPHTCPSTHVCLHT